MCDKSTYRDAPFAWWENFVPQLAMVACVYGLDTWDDGEFNECVALFLDISRSN